MVQSVQLSREELLCEFMSMLQRVKWKLTMEFGHLMRHGTEGIMSPAML